MSALSLILRSIRHAWLRNTMLILSVLIAYLLFGSLMAFDRAYGASSEVSSYRIVTTNKLSFTQPMPMSHFRELRTIDGVQEASFASWFGGFYRESRNRLHTIAVDPPSYLSVYGDDLKLSDDERARFVGSRDAMLVGQSMAERFGWKVGDLVPIINPQIARSDGSETWTFRVAGIVQGATAYVDTNFVYIHYELLNEARARDKGTIGWIVTDPEPDQDASELSEIIDLRFASASARTTTDSERSFAQTFVAQFGDLALATVLILGAAFFCLLVVVGSTTALAIEQRSNEIGILKGLGFSHRRIFALLIGETLAVVVAGGLAGLGLAHLAVAASAEMMTPIAPGIAVTLTIFVGGLVTMIVLALLASGLPAWRAIDRPAAEVLR